MAIRGKTNAPTVRALDSCVKRHADAHHHSDVPVIDQVAELAAIACAVDGLPISTFSTERMKNLLKKANSSISEGISEDTIKKNLR